MKRIDYEGIIPNFVGPKLVKHGFKYDRSGSSPPEGYYSFARKYWCALQRVSIMPVSYDSDEIDIVLSKKKDSPTEVPKSLLHIKEPEYRLWLSNRYIQAELQHKGTLYFLGPGERIDLRAKPPMAPRDLLNGRSEAPVIQLGDVPVPAWEFQGEDDLRRVLSEIVQITTTDGLDWLNSMVADVRQYHEELDRQRKLVRESA
jgi:hypothetical protein